MEYQRLPNLRNKHWPSYVVCTRAQFPVYLFIAILEEKYRTDTNFSYFSIDDYDQGEFDVKQYFSAKTPEILWEALQHHDQRVNLTIFVHSLLEKMGISSLSIEGIAQFYSSLFDATIYTKQIQSEQNTAISLSILEQSDTCYIFFRYAQLIPTQNIDKTCIQCRNFSHFMPHAQCKVCALCLLQGSCPVCYQAYTEPEFDVLEGGISLKVTSFQCNCGQQLDTKTQFDVLYPEICQNCAEKTPKRQLSDLNCSDCGSSSDLVSTCLKGCTYCVNCLKAKGHLAHCPRCSSPVIYYSLNCKPVCCFSAKRTQLVKQGKHFCHLECLLNGKCRYCRPHN